LEVRNFVAGFRIIKSKWKPDCVFEPWVERLCFVFAIAIAIAIAIGVIMAGIVEQTL
jgi:hypothetical protein